MNYKKFFGRETGEVAEDLLGRLLIRRTEKGIYTSTITETGAYVGGELTQAREGMLYDPGKIFLMPFRGCRLLNIASGEGDMACVEIRELRDIREKIEGSGKITSFLEIPDSLDGKFLGEESGLFISDEKYFQKKTRKDKGRVDNCKGIYSFREE